MSSQLVSFAEVARLKSYRAAAARLNIAQPAISRQIQALEESLGLALFDRNNRRVILTKAGEWLNQEVGPILTRLDRLFLLREERTVSSACAGISIPLYRSDEGSAYTGGEVQGRIANRPSPS
jgi:DNA-binding transcriptional LysR family regulator